MIESMIRIEKDTHRRLKLMATIHNYTFSQAITYLLDYYDNHKPIKHKYVDGEWQETDEIVDPNQLKLDVDV